MTELDRRRFVEGVASGFAVAATMPWSRASAQRTLPELTGDEIALDIGAHPINVTGVPGIATAINGSVPGPTLRWREGQTVTVRVRNRLDLPTSIHWHGILLPWNMDGVPGLSFPGIGPGETFTYRFPVRQAGTYWYHSHTGFQEQLGMYGALVIDPASPDPVAYDRDHTIVLSDWTDEDPMRIFARLKKMSHYYNFDRRTLRDIREEVARGGRAAVRRDRAMWNQMRMSDRDIADVTGATYTYLMNGQPPAADWKAIFRRGERVRLRVVNAAAMTIFDLQIPGLELTVVAADGQNVEPVTVRELRIGVAETFDVIVRPSDDSAYAIFAQSIDRSGYARGTLTPDPSLSAPVPALDPPPVLSMVDMGVGPAADDMAMDHAQMNHAQMDHAATQDGPARIARGPGVDMIAADPQPRLDDPGVGLRDRAWPVLTLGALTRLGLQSAAHDYDREIELHLTGNMERYMWSFDGLPFSKAPPIELKQGERVRFVLVNDTMMHHPIHLHGLWSDVETGSGGELVRMHTVLVQPGQRVAYGVTADAPGPWAYHCHLLYHMEAGMFRVVDVS